LPLRLLIAKLKQTRHGSNVVAIEVLQLGFTIAGCRIHTAARNGVMLDYGEFDWGGQGVWIYIPVVKIYSPGVWIYIPESVIKH
jgi:hypothetical protein